MLLHHLCDQDLSSAAHRKSGQEIIIVRALLTSHRVHHFGNKLRRLRLIVVRLLHGLARKQRRFHLALIEKSYKDSNDCRIELCSAAVFELTEDCLLRQSISIDPLRVHRIITVRNRDNTCLDWNLFIPKSLRITGSIVPLMMIMCHIRNMIDQRDVL